MYIIGPTVGPTSSTILPAGRDLLVDPFPKCNMCMTHMAKAGNDTVGPTWY